MKCRASLLRWTFVVFTAFAVARTAGSATNTAPTLLESFEGPDVLARVETTNAQPTVVQTGATHGKQALRIEFQPTATSMSAVKIKSIALTDWSRFGQLIVDVTNLADEPQRFSVRVDGSNRQQRSAARTLEPKESGAFTLSFADPTATGMRTSPVAPGTLALLGNPQTPFAFGQVESLTVYRYGAKPAAIIIDNIRLAPPFDLERIVDAYGQYTRSDWPGKIHAPDELLARKRAEEEELSLHSPSPEFDAYDGWTRGPKLPASGFFRTEKVGGKWWLITPAGHVFFSIGMDCVSLANQTFVSGRESMFSWLPGEDDPLHKHVGTAKGRLGYGGPHTEGATMNFFAANLERKYGPNFLEAYVPVTLQRLRAWGFNTVAAWSDDPFCFRQSSIRVPYTVIVHPRSVSLNSANGYTPDPFADSFAEDTQRGIRAVADRVKDDPWCIGFFVDNEHTWWPAPVLRGALANDAASSAGKRVLLDDLREKYREISALNSAWATTFDSWETLVKPVTLGGFPNNARNADGEAFVGKAVRQYFKVVRHAVKSVAPHHLYLGCRFAGGAPDPVQAAAAEFCDVVSVNIYDRRIGRDWGFTGGQDKPWLIGEFHFGALDRGMFGQGQVPARNQVQRAERYVEFINSALDHPSVIGCHWFQYHDQPLTGRSLDGENDNLGFVDIADTPFPELVSAAKEIHATAYRRRSAVNTGSVAIP